MRAGERIFISYKSEDCHAARTLAEWLEYNRIPTWFAEYQIRLDEQDQFALERASRGARCDATDDDSWENLLLGNEDEPDDLSPERREAIDRETDEILRQVSPVSSESADLACGSLTQTLRSGVRQCSHALILTNDLYAGSEWCSVEAKAVLEMSSLRTQDHRRNVVHVIDVYEARQWELPVVFVCGLIEREFPRYHAENPLLADDARRRLARGGVHLRTSVERDDEERFLFDLAVTRATELLVLSYRKYNAKGDENLPSFLLQHFIESNRPREESSRPARPKPLRARAPQRRWVVHDGALLEWLSVRHARLSPTSIETFLQCPFRFFAERTLGLRPPPARPAERLDALVQGSIVHQLLAELLREPQPLEPLFDRVFEGFRAEERIPAGYRTEAVRLEMIESLRLFLDDQQAPPAGQVRTEEEFELALGEGLTIRGRIDRLDVIGDGNTHVIDYKYTRSANLGRLLKDNNGGRRVQAGLYLRAVREFFGYEPAGMSFCAMRRGVGWRGWDKPEELTYLVSLSTAQALGVAQQIREEGCIEPDPAEAEACEYCDFRDICRVETAAVAAIAAPSALTGGGSQ